MKSENGNNEGMKNTSKKKTKKVSTTKKVEVNLFKDLQGRFLHVRVGDRARPATDDDINDVIANITEAYENILLIEDVSPTLALSLDVCRIEALNVLEDKLQITPNVEDFTLKVPTIDVELAYRLYAEEFNTSEDLSSKADILTELNDILPTRYRETVRVLKL